MFIAGEHDTGIDNPQFGLRTIQKFVCDIILKQNKRSFIFKIMENLYQIALDISLQCIYFAYVRGDYLYRTINIACLTHSRITLEESVRYWYWIAAP